jgi:hypothetical protein
MKNNQNLVQIFASSAVKQFKSGKIGKIWIELHHIRRMVERVKKLKNKRHFIIPINFQKRLMLQSIIASQLTLAT